MKRVLTALVLMPAVAALVWWAPAWLLFLSVVPVVGLGLREFVGLAGRMGPAPSQALLYPSALALLWLAWIRPANLLAGFLVIGLLVLVCETFLREENREIFPAATAGFLGLAYVALPFGFLLDLRATPNGRRLVLLVLILVWAGDTAAYYVGRALGRHKLAPLLSPAKTVEGGIASLAATVALGYWLIRGQGWVEQAGAVQAWALPLVVNLAAQVGDLVESALKRGAGVKDSSALLPGHGGLLDRVDALLLALPALWYYYFFVLSG